MPININCDECRDRIDDSEEIICIQCHKREVANLQQRIEERNHTIQDHQETITELRHDIDILKEQIAANSPHLT